MPDEPDLRHYEREPTRVRTGSGKPWLAVWTVVAVGVIAIGVGGTLMSPQAGEPAPARVAQADAPAVTTQAPAEPPVKPSDPDASQPPLDITSGASGYTAAFDSRRRRSTPLVVESTDFHANAGAAYYGIGGKLIRALAPVPTRTPNPGDAPD